jgi:hypothetical protein
MAPPPILVGQTVALPPQVQNSAQVHAAFEAFAKSYLAAVDGVLLAPNHAGGLDPAAHRPAFDAAVKQALETLVHRVVAALGDQPAGSTLSTQVVDAILGDGADSLENQLKALSTSAIEGIADSSDSLPTDATQTIQQAATRVATMLEAPSAVAPVVIQGQAVAIAGATAAAPDDAPAAEASSLALSQAREAFSNFLSDYYRAVRDVLLATGADGTMDAAAAREGFDARVGASLKALVDAVSRDLESASSSPVVTARVQSAIEGPGSCSLEAQLASLQTPDSLEAATVRAFTIGAFRAVTSVFSIIAGDLAAIT